MLTRLHVKGFKSLLDVDVRLAPLVVVTGPNAVGKSNFLEALLLLSHLVTERTLADAFTAPLRGYPVEAFAVPDGGLRSLLGQDSAELSMEADIRPGGWKQGDTIRYHVTVRVRPKTGVLEVVDEYLVRLKNDGRPRHAPRIEKENGHLVVRRLGEEGQPRHEPLGLNHTLVSNLRMSGEEHYPDFDQLREEMSSWRTFYLDPRRAMREPRPPMETEDIGPRGEYVAPFLHRLKESEGHRRYFHAVRRALHAAIPTIEDLEVDLDPERGHLDVRILQEGTPYSSRVMSEGTLRVLALCAIAANPWPNRLVAFEEPENGVHPRRIETVADLLTSMVGTGRRQVIVTTHSPALIAAMARRKREMEEDLVLLLRCIQDGRATRVVPFDELGPWLEDKEIEKALTGSGDAGVLEQAFLRGWLDG